MTEAKQPVPEPELKDLAIQVAAFLESLDSREAQQLAFALRTRATQSPESHAELTAALTSEDCDLIIGAIPLQALPEPPSADAERMAFELVSEYGGTDNVGLLRAKIAAALTTAQAQQREVDAGIAETKAGRRCLRHQQSGKGVCGYEIANAIRAGGKQ